MKKKEFNQDELNDILNKYQNEYMPMSKIGKLYGVSKTVISRVLKENKIEIRCNNHIYHADYHKFQNIDSPEKAYWAGFIAADGCVYERETNATIRIAIHQKDKKHLEKFRNFMNSNAKITEFVNNTGLSKNNPSPMCAIAFYSKDMAHDLIDIGIIPRKSLVLEPPKINSKYYLPYILGYFDGDGTIYKFNNNTEFIIGFTGSLVNIQWINETLNMNAKLEQRVFGSSTYYIRCGGTNKPYQFLKMLYDSVDVHLDRKYELFKELEEKVVLNGNIE